MFLLDYARMKRDKARKEEEERRQKADAEIKRKQEEAERKKLLETAIQEKVDQPGMIYNPATREYQYVHDHTQDDWRD